MIFNLKNIDTHVLFDLQSFLILVLRTFVSKCESHLFVRLIYSISLWQQRNATTYSVRVHRGFRLGCILKRRLLQGLIKVFSGIKKLTEVQNHQFHDFAHLLSACKSRYHVEWIETLYTVQICIGNDSWIYPKALRHSELSTYPKALLRVLQRPCMQAFIFLCSDSYWLQAAFIFRLFYHLSCIYIILISIFALLLAQTPVQLLLVLAPYIPLSVFCEAAHEKNEPSFAVP